MNIHHYKTVKKKKKKLHFSSGFLVEPDNVTVRSGARQEKLSLEGLMERLRGPT